MRVTKHILLTMWLMGGIVLGAEAQKVEDAPKMRELNGKELLGDLVPMQHKKGLWGYANSANKFVIKPVFEEALPYEGRVARIRWNGQWGVINRNGLYVVPPMYAEIKEFSVDSLAIVSNSSDQYGLIDAKGWICQPLEYTTMEPANYGYLATKDQKYSTIYKDGKIIHDRQFDQVELLEKDASIELFYQHGKWGVMKDGRDLLAHRWDEKLQLLNKAAGDRPNLYLGIQHNTVGVVTAEGKQVAPCYFDHIELHESGRYYITNRKGKYGALSLKMTEIIPPMLDERPTVSEKIYPVYDGYNFWCANINGRIEFRVCADVYSATNHEEYAKTTDYPEWAKRDIVEANLMDRETDLNNARTLYDIMTRREYDVNMSKYDPTMPKNSVLFYPENDTKRYGVSSYVKFVPERGYISMEKSAPLPYTLKSADSSIYFVSSDSGKQHYIYANKVLISINEALNKFNVKPCTSFYVKDYVKLSDQRFVVRFAFVRPEIEAGESMVETESYNLPVSNDELELFSGIPSIKNEAYGALTFDIGKASVVAFAQLPKEEARLLASSFDGFYTCSSSTVIADEKNSVKRYNRNGELEWEFTAKYDEVFFDMDETECYVYLCGYTKNSGVERPLIVQLDKAGARVQSLTKEYSNARFTGIKCANYLIYAKLEGKGNTLGPAFYPHFVLQDINDDNMYMTPHCAWEDWGGKIIGGCGLITADGKWIQSPIIDKEQMCTMCNWEFSSFNGDYLIVRHMGKYGVIDRWGEMVISPKYDHLEYLDNPNYFKASINKEYGVIDATGRIIVPVENDYVGRMCEDIIIVKRDGLYGCFDAHGRNVVPFEYEEIKEYVGGMARICVKGRYGFIDKSGEILVAPFSDNVENFAEDCTLVTIKNKVGFVTLQGDWIVPPMYDAGGSFAGGLAPLSLGGMFGYINKSGEFVIPMRYDFADVFNAQHKIARVRRGGKWGVVNMDGKDVIPLIYDDVVICADGYIYVKQNGKCGIFSSQGEQIYPVMCDDRISYNSKSVLFKHGIAHVVVDGKRVAVDQFGNLIMVM